MTVFYVYVSKHLKFILECQDCNKSDYLSKYDSIAGYQAHLN